MRNQKYLKNFSKGHIQICLNSKYFAKQVLYNFKTYKYFTKYNLKEI